jgi:hypothetical protein
MGLSSGDPAAVPVHPPQPPARTWHDLVNVALMAVLTVGSITSAGLSCRSSQIAADSLRETQRNNDRQQGDFRDAARQQRQHHDTLLRAQLFNYSVNYSSLIDRALLEKPKLRKYLYGGQGIDEGHPDYDEFATLADTVIDLLDVVLFMTEIKDSDGQPSWPGVGGWRNWMLDIISTSPGLRAYFARHEDWYFDNPPLKELFSTGGRRAGAMVAGGK